MIPFSEKLISTIFNQFYSDQKFVDVLGNDFLLKYYEIFVDCTCGDINKICVYKIIEKMDYPLFNSHHPNKIALSQRHVVKHFNENEIIKILNDLISFFQTCDFADKKVLVSGSMICYSKDRYRLFIGGFENKLPAIAHKAIFDEEEKNQPPQGPVFLNKLEIQKSSHKTTDTANTEQLPENNCSKTRVDLKTVDYYKLCVSICYGLFKDMAYAFFGISPDNKQSFYSILSKEKFSKFTNLLEIFEIINQTKPETVNYECVDTWRGKMSQYISTYFDSFFNFKNQEVLLLNQPIFSGIHKLKLELSHNLSNVHCLASFISKELQKLDKLTSLELHLNDVLLNPHELLEIFQPITQMNGLTRLVLKLCHNNIDQQCIDRLVEITSNRSLDTFDVSLCE